MQVKHTIKTILNRKDLFDLENKITQQVGQVVNRDFLDAAVDFIERDIHNSGLKLEAILHVIESKKNELIEFSTKLLLTFADDFPDEEYPEGEELDDTERNVELESNGISVGFVIQYAIYYHFLTSYQLEEFTAYLKKSRIPNALKFSKRLEAIFKVTLK